MDHLGNEFNLMSGILNAVLVGTGAKVNMLVSGAGTSAVNGTYTPTGTRNSKQYYNLTGTSSIVSAISWDGGSWNIYAASGQANYNSGDNVATPDLVTTWTAAFGGSNPVPTVVLA